MNKLTTQARNARKRLLHFVRSLGRRRLSSSRQDRVLQELQKVIGQASQQDDHAPFIGLAGVNDASPSSDLAIVAMRSDGLGERLNAFVTGIYLARRLGWPFGFRWASAVHADAIAFGKPAVQTHILGHAVVAADQLFSKEFIERFQVPSQWRPREFKPLSGKKMEKATLNSIGSAGFRGWRAPPQDVRPMLEEQLRPSPEFSYRQAFDTIGFSPEAQKSLQAGYRVQLPRRVVALHLRSGDVFYGEYRKFAKYSYKGLTLPLAKALIAKQQKKGRGVLLFGQDNRVLDYLKEEFGVLLARDHMPSFCTTDHQRALFDVALMSRAEKIFAGTSGFARLAALVGGAKVRQPHDLFPVEEQSAMSIADLSENGDLYHPLQTAFAYWYAYYCARRAKTYQEAVSLLARAYEYDPENQLYPIVMAALHFRNQRPAEGERVLTAVYLRDSSECGDGTLPVLKILVARTKEQFNLSEYFPDFLTQKDSSLPHTLLCVATILNAMGEHVAAVEQLHFARAQLPNIVPTDFESRYFLNR